MTIREPLVLLSLLCLLLLDLGLFRFPGWPLFQSSLGLLVLFKASRGLLRHLLDLRRLRREDLRNRHFLRGPWRPVIPAFLAFWVAVLAIAWSLRWIPHPTETWQGLTPVRDRTLLHAFCLLELLRTLWKGPGLRRAVQNFLEANPLRTFFLLYASAAFFGTLLLILPISLRDGAHLSLVDAFFLSVSAVSVTGLAPVSTAATLSFFGHFVLLFLIQIGGLGIVTLGAGLAALAGHRLSLSHSLASAQAHGSPDLAGLNRFVGRVFATTFACEAAGSLALYFFLPSHQEGRFFHAVFHAVSAFCNAGFSSFPPGLEVPGLLAFKSVVGTLIVTGGIGFPILFEVFDRSRNPQRRRLPWPPYLLLTVGVSLALLILGTVGLYLTESTALAVAGRPAAERFGNALFYSVSSRTAGFGLVPHSTLTIGSQLLIVVLMAIGGSPLSTAGGLKTTTIGVLVSAALSSLRGHRWIQFGRSEISASTLLECVAIVLIYLLLAFGSLLVLLPFEAPDAFGLFFEIVSALSTVGLSLDVTPQLSAFGKLWISGLMLAGRFGIVALVYMGIGRVREQRFRYAERVYYVG